MPDRRGNKSSSVSSFVPTMPQARRPVHDDMDASSPKDQPRKRIVKGKSPGQSAAGNTTHSGSASEDDGSGGKSDDWENPYNRARHSLDEMREGDHLQSDPLDSDDEQRSRKKPADSINCCYVVSVFVAILFVGAVAGNLYYGIDPIDDYTLSSQNLDQEIKIIQKEFPSQDRDMWPSFLSGIRNILHDNSTVPTVFLLMHNNNEKFSSCLARRVGIIAQRFMKAARPEPLELDGNVLGRVKEFEEDRGLFIERYKPLVQQHGVMILNNIQAVPADLARSLHAFSDQVTPLVGRAVYIFSLDTGKTWQGSNLKEADNQLNTAWSKLDPDIRRPLIVRVTGGTVFRIKPEANSKMCQ